MTPKALCTHICTCEHRWMSGCRAASGSCCRDCGTRERIHVAPTCGSKIRNSCPAMHGGYPEEEGCEESTVGSCAHVRPPVPFVGVCADYRGRTRDARRCTGAEKANATAGSGIVACADPRTATGVRHS